jgi:hypothetical protein
MKGNYFRLLFKLILPCVFSVLISSCGSDDDSDQPEDSPKEQKQITAPAFNADSAYAYIQQQVNFGPRVPGTPAQKACAAWMENKLKEFCDTVYRQSVQVKAGDGRMLPCINLIGSINPSATRRVLLLAHWDTRPWGDMDTKEQDKPILGADDGGSGVGVLLEVARQLKLKPLQEDLGIDILFTDVEDYGKTEWGDDSYALGTQHWARQPHVPGYKAEFGILLDMVGARDAKFPLEGTSSKYAGSVQQRVWQTASALGLSSFFPSVAGAEITDDHVFVNEIIRIPTIDIINLNSKTQSAFAPHWHTHQDDMSIIDRNTLKAVGETLLQVIYDTAQPAQS